MHTHGHWRTVGAGMSILFACALWGGFAYLTVYLEQIRAEYAERVAIAAETAERQESLIRLRSLVESTEAERNALEGIMQVRIVDAAETIEEAVRVAGGQEIEISEASAGAPNVQGISAVSIGVSATGSFNALMRAVLLLETLPLPSQLEQYEIAKHEKEWRLVARLRLSLAGVQ